jgi:hypothetical protein
MLGEERSEKKPRRRWNGGANISDERKRVTHCTSLPISFRSSSPLPPTSLFSSPFPLSSPHSPGLPIQPRLYTHSLTCHSIGGATSSAWHWRSRPSSLSCSPQRPSAWALRKAGAAKRVCEGSSLHSWALGWPGRIGHLGKVMKGGDRSERCLQQRDQSSSFTERREKKRVFPSVEKERQRGKRKLLFVFKSEETVRTWEELLAILEHTPVGVRPDFKPRICSEITDQNQSWFILQVCESPVLNPSPRTWCG